MKKLTLSDIGTLISEEKGWTGRQVMGRKKRDIIIIMVIRAPDKSVLAITDYHKTTRKKCKAIRAFMERNRQNGS